MKFGIKDEVWHRRWCLASRLTYPETCFKSPKGMMIRGIICTLNSEKRIESIYSHKWYEICIILEVGTGGNQN